MIASFPDIADNSRFVVIPGQNDLGLGGSFFGALGASCLPHAPLPKRCAAALSKVCKRIGFGSNPCRLRFYDREYVFFRDDIVAR